MHFIYLYACAGLQGGARTRDGVGVLFMVLLRGQGFTNLSLVTSDVNSDMTSDTMVIPRSSFCDHDEAKMTQL